METYCNRIVDKVAFLVPLEFIDTSRESKQIYNGKGGNFIEDSNLINKRYYYVNTHDIEISDNENILHIVSERFIKLFYCDQPLFKELPTEDFLIKHCKLAELEIAFDFYNHQPYHFKKSKRWNICKNSTYYTDDYKIYRRKDGTINKKQSSLIIFYDRGLKIKSEESISRIEYRFKGKYMRNFISTADLYQPFYCLYTEFIYPKIIKHTPELLDKKMIRFLKSELKKNNSEFLGVLLDSGWYSK